MRNNSDNKWPKKYRELTEEEKKIKDDFMHYCHEVLPKKYGIVEVFNHNYPTRKFKRVYDTKNYWKTLEIGESGHIFLLKNVLKDRIIMSWSCDKISLMI